METRKVLVATDRIYDVYDDVFDDVLFGVFDSVEAIEKRLKLTVICMGITNINFRSKVNNGRQFWRWDTVHKNVYDDLVTREHTLTYEVHEVLGVE